METKIPNLL